MVPKIAKKYMTTPAWIKGLLVTSSVAVALGLSGCASTSAENSHGVLPSTGPSMAQIYNGQIDETSNHPALARVRSHLPSQDAHFSEDQLQSSSTVSRRSASAFGASFERVGSNLNAPRLLPNPLIQIDVYPHFDPGSHAYIPAHTAYITLYNHRHFALPGEC